MRLCLLFVFNLPQITLLVVTMRTHALCRPQLIISMSGLVVSRGHWWAGPESLLNNNTALHICAVLYVL